MGGGYLPEGGTADFEGAIDTRACQKRTVVSNNYKVDLKVCKSARHSKNGELNNIMKTAHLVNGEASPASASNTRHSTGRGRSWERFQGRWADGEARKMREREKGRRTRELVC